MVEQRLASVNAHFDTASNYNGRQAGALRDDDVVIVGMARTAMTRAKRGAQANTPLEDMLKVALEGAIAMSKIPADKVDEVIVGNVLAPGSAASQIRMAMFLAGIPHRASCQGINRMCSSGLQSVASIANAIKAGDIEIGIGGGVESMSNFNMMGAVDANFLSDAVFESETARNCLIPMGVTSENVAEKFGVTRDTQDAFAVTSHAKATAADKAGWLQSEITPYTTTVKDKEGEMQEVRVDRDDGMRPQTTVESLGKLKPAFKKGGSSTAGNSSQMTDGAACVMLARRDVAKKLGATIMGRIVSFSADGVPPEIMGIGPAVAIPHALEKAGLTLDDMDVFEINEAFAS